MKTEQTNAVLQLSARLCEVLGKEYVFTDAETRALYSTDFSEIAMPAASLIVRPSSTVDIVAVVKAAAAEGFAILTRGGGMSYTLGFVPLKKESVVIDMRRMNRILEINTDDLYVVVETGVTWKQLREALVGCPFHIPFHGTISGYVATVGGGLGNMATGLGRGEIVDDLLGMEVVLADGSVIQTGCLVTGGKLLTVPNFGPNLTELFVSDGGAFGVKTKAVFRLSRKPGASSYASFGFNDRHQMVSAYCDMLRLDVCTEVTCCEDYHHTQLATEQKLSRKEALEFAGRFLRSSSSRLRGIRDLFRCLRPGGLNTLTRYPFSLHAVVDGFDQRTADRKMAEVKKIARREGGKTLPPFLAMGLRIDPFLPVDKLILGKNGSCSIPSHCLVPLSKAHDFVSALERFMSDNTEFMKRHDLEMTLLVFNVTEKFGVEPIIYWRDKLNPLRLSILDAEKKALYGSIPEDTAAREAVQDLRRRLVDVFLQVDGAYAQLGKYYPYRERFTNENNWRILEGVKELLDPRHLMNPGALGLK